MLESIGVKWEENDSAHTLLMFRVEYPGIFVVNSAEGALEWFPVSGADVVASYPDKPIFEQL